MLILRREVTEGRHTCIIEVMILDLAWIGAAWLGVASLGIMLFGVAWVDVAWLSTASCGLRSLNSTLRGFVLLIVVFVSLDVNFPVISTVSSTWHNCAPLT